MTKRIGEHHVHQAAHHRLHMTGRRSHLITMQVHVLDHDLVLHQLEVQSFAEVVPIVVHLLKIQVCICFAGLNIFDYSTVFMYFSQLMSIELLTVLLRGLLWN